jgi:hypothetical protein
MFIDTNRYPIPALEERRLERKLTLNNLRSSGAANFWSLLSINIPSLRDWIKSNFPKPAPAILVVPLDR